ncbi:MAG: hypothetical protein ACP5VF_02560 [Acidobacteriota bacterium]
MVKACIATALFALVVLPTAAQMPGGPPARGPGAGPDQETRRDVAQLYLVQRMREALALTDAQTLKVMDLLQQIDRARMDHQAAIRSLVSSLQAQLDDPKTPDSAFRESVESFRKGQEEFERRVRDLESRLLAVMTPRQQVQFLLLRRQLLMQGREGMRGAGDEGRPLGRRRR